MKSQNNSPRVDRHAWRQAERFDAPVVFTMAFGVAVAALIATTF